MKLPNIITSVIGITLLIFFTLPANANLASDLSDDQHVLLMRHADAPGYGDPAGYQLDNCATQRNLGENGKKQAVIIGQWLSSQGIETATVISSVWCRCFDTAKLLNKGVVTTSPALGSFFDDMSQERKQTQELEKLIQTQLKANPKIPLILVTHHVNIQGYAGKAVNVGDMVLVKVDKNGKFVSQKIYSSPSY
jgi:phosphohistidine phosphatase SixA